MPPKLLLIGNALLSKSKLSAICGEEFEVVDLPFSFPADYLDYLGEFSMIIVNHDPGKQEEGLVKLQEVRNCKLHKIQHIPLLLIAASSTREQVLDAFQYEFFDFLFWPAADETLLLQRVERHAYKKVREIESVSTKKNKPLTEMLCDWLLGGYQMGIMPAWLHDKNEVSLPENALRVQYFGEFLLYYKGQPLVCELTRKQKTLLAYLLYQHPRAVHRDRIIDWLWPDVDGDSARNSLNNAIWHIRQWLDAQGIGGENLVFKDQLYSFHRRLTITSDAAAFTNSLKEAYLKERNNQPEEALHAFHRAFAYYKGPFLEAFCEDSWAARECDRLREQYLPALDKLAQHYSEQTQYQLAVNLSQRLLDIDPLSEAAHRRLMFCYSSMGLLDKALQQFEICKSLLHQRLGAAPSEKTTALLRQIRQCA
ncbi:MAG: winged helix-turn-helix domain-containing protein [Saprospiraceae bacterium]|nr:winged helix-turn-helix domain-containing protein [Saprospiraceae bacterium]